MNKSRLLMGAAIAALVLAPTAQAVGGFGEIKYSNINLDNGMGDIDIDAISFGGVLSTPVGSNWNAQFDVQFTHFDGDNFFGPGDDSIFGGTGAAHINYSTNNWLLGLYANVGQIESTTVYGGGIEGQVFIHRIAIAGSIGINDTDDTFSDSFWDARIGAKYFITDNASIGLNYSHIDFDNDFSANSYGIEAEYKLPDCGASIFAGYNHVQFEDIGPSDDDADVIQVGLRWTLNDESLIQREHSAPNLTRGNALFGGTGFAF